MFPHPRETIWKLSPNLFVRNWSWFFFCSLLKNLKIFKVTLRKLQVSHNNSIFFCAFSSGAPNEDSVVSENAGIEPRTVLQVALTTDKAASDSHQWLHLVHICTSRPENRGELADSVLMHQCKRCNSPGFNPPTPLPEFIDPVFAKTSPNARFQSYKTSVLGLFSWNLGL